MRTREGRKYVLIDGDLHKRLKLLAVHLNVDMQELASKAVREFLEREERLVANGGKRGRRTGHDEK